MRSTAAPERVARPAELTPHRSRHFVSRSRVRGCLAEAATSRAVIVTGPPGAGKTLAIAHTSVYRGLEQLVEPLPAPLQLVRASRVDPPLPLALWRARGTIGEVRQRDLAFRVDEVAAFFATFPELRLDAEEIELLAER